MVSSQNKRNSEILLMFFFSIHEGLEIGLLRIPRKIVALSRIFFPYNQHSLNVDSNEVGKLNQWKILKKIVILKEI